MTCVRYVPHRSRVFREPVCHARLHRTRFATITVCDNVLSKTVQEPLVGVKTGGSRVGGSRNMRLGSMVTGDRGHDVYPGSGPLYGGNTLLPT